MSDTISRQAAIEALRVAYFDNNIQSAKDDPCIVDAMTDWAIRQVKALPPAQPKQTDCEYCHEDSDGYVRPLEKNCHAFVRYGINGWEISLKAKGWSGSAKIKYCPMCGRELKHG